MFKSSFRSPTILLAGKPFCYVIFACYRMISYYQAEIGLWTGSLLGEGAKKTKGKNKRKDGEGSTLHSLCLLIYVYAFPHCRACSQAKLKFTQRNWPGHTAMHVKLSVALYYNLVNCDRPGECSAEKDCLRWHWQTFWQPEWKSSLDDDDFGSGCGNTSQCHLKQTFSRLHSPGYHNLQKTLPRSLDFWM